jgi:hypothetical protein
MKRCDNHQRVIRESLVGLGVSSIRTARRRLATLCIMRLGISHREYDRWCWHLGVVRDDYRRRLDKVKWLNECRIEEACHRLRISVGVLRCRLEYSDVGSVYATEMRRYLGIVYNRSKARLMCRSDDTRMRHARIRILWKRGWTYREIAIDIGTTVGCIIQTVNRMRYSGMELDYRPPGGCRN